MSCLIFGVIIDMELPHPMDALSFLSLSICTCSLLYACTLLLDVRFRGDFGVILDHVGGDLDGTRADIDYFESSSSSSGSSSSSSSSIVSSSSSGSGSSSSSSRGSGGSSMLDRNRELGRALHHHHHSQSLDADAASCCDATTKELLAVPYEDMCLLFSQPARSGYGSKLHNLKLDIKDV